MVFCRETVEETDHALVDEAPELTFWASCVVLACVAGNEREVRVRYTYTSIVLDPGPSLGQMLP